MDEVDVKRASDPPSPEAEAAASASSSDELVKLSIKLTRRQLSALTIASDEQQRSLSNLLRVIVSDWIEGRA